MWTGGSTDLGGGPRGTQSEPDSSSWQAGNGIRDSGRAGLGRPARRRRGLEARRRASRARAGNLEAPLSRPGLSPARRLQASRPHDSLKTTMLAPARELSARLVSPHAPTGSSRPRERFNAGRRGRVVAGEASHSAGVPSPWRAPNGIRGLARRNQCPERERAVWSGGVFLRRHRHDRCCGMRNGPARQTPLQPASRLSWARGGGGGSSRSGQGSSLS